MAAGLDLGPLKTADRRRSRRQPTGGVPGAVVGGREQALDLAHEAIRTLENAQAALAVLPSFLGADGPRHYFLGMQNPAELRGTGGLIGYFAVLTADHGKLTMSDPERLRRPGPAGRRRPHAGPHLQGVRRTIRPHAAAGFFANVNVDPDLPTTAKVILDLYEARKGRRLDGVVMVDPVGLGMILKGIGPMRLPRGRRGRGAAQPGATGQGRRADDDRRLRRSGWALEGA